MFGRIIKFRRGDQYEEMQGRDVAGKTTDANRPKPNDNSNDQTNRQPDDARDSTAAPQDTTPDGTFSKLYSVLLTTYVSVAIR